ncbi:LLM class F420-dependent oxidoreductase [Streptomyces anulatus]|uniref:LLM class F420-dependent oxidoreductase n=1 Tax=Streptomyces anulatus TaxID=1892 RepID=UPI001C25F01C|nr:LLM class F420-dependent oxidoreductase [Streptomyces anulatus]
MKFGVATFLTDESIRPTALGPALEERGLDALFLAEHTHIPVDPHIGEPGSVLPRQYFRTLDPFVALGAAAAVTRTLTLGTGIALLVQRDPITTAKEVATLDLISDGRAVFGVGAGWNRAEMAHHGTDPRTRGALLDERLRAMIELWTKEKAEFHGNFVDFGPSYAWPKPVQQPHPPIYVGGDSEAAWARLAAYGAAWMPNNVVPEDLAAKVTRMREATGTRTPVVVHAAQYDSKSLETYASAGVERVLLDLPTAPEDEVLKVLDEMAAAAAPYR